MQNLLKILFSFGMIGLLIESMRDMVRGLSDLTSCLFNTSHKATIRTLPINKVSRLQIAWGMKSRLMFTCFLGYSAW